MIDKLIFDQILVTVLGQNSYSYLIER